MIASYASLNIFCFKMSACFSWRFYFKTSRKILCPSKKTVVGCFKTVLRLQDRHIFIRQSLEILNVFNLLTFKQFFWKKTLFWKTGVLLFSWKRFEITFVAILPWWQNDQESTSLLEIPFFNENYVIPNFR